ncbi:uncharacterized protein LOC127278615 [Leptopilina boulardi]|uniref:uncharacterized protein LOC127278615 n=1 Tax=Leptopilina boulardi TaxID=63433 RepID=UPI0021F676A8|nr:uncharacterized protein LOC127278615 [Leptopilina boulardi]
MLKKVLSKSGRRILRAIKKLSTSGGLAKKSRPPTPEMIQPWHSIISDAEEAENFDSLSLSCSLPSLDTKSIDTYVTYVAEGLDSLNSRGESTSPCSYCNEHEENQRNENLENEMIN